MKKFNYVPVKMMLPNHKFTKEVATNCEYIKYGFQIERNLALCSGAASMIRSANMDIWQNISPRHGKYLLEFIFELPFFLPNHKKSPEYLLTFHNKKYVINNRHCEIITNVKDKYLFAHHNAMNQPEPQRAYEYHQFIKLKTLVSTQFTIRATNASDAMENNFFDCLEICKNDINKLITVLRYCTDKSPDLIPDCANLDTVCPTYVLCKGKITGILRFAKHISSSMLQPLSSINKMTKPDIEKYLNGTSQIDEAKHLWIKSKQLFESGEYSSACIFACIACETVMLRYLKISLKKKGLGKSKIKEAVDNVLFSQLIKLTGNLVYNINNTPIKTALGKIDKMRKIRNAVIHEGKTISSSEINIIQSGIDSVKFILDHK